MRSTLTRPFAALLAVGALASAGCGSTSPTAGGHHLRLGYAADCAFHVWRAHHDIKTGHRLLAAFNVWRSIHNCPRAIR